MELTLIFDVETTGLIQNRSLKDKLQPRVFEFFGCLADLETNDDPLSELHLWINPEREIEAKAQKVTGIDPQFLLDKPKFSDVAIQIKDYICSAPMVVAHNCSFDVEMLDMEFERAGVPIDWPRQVCTVESTLHTKGRRMSLSELHEHLFGMKFKDAHKAKNDVLALLRIARELYRREMI